MQSYLFTVPKYDLDEFKHFENTSIDLVMSKMIHPDKIIIRKGSVPETLYGIEDTFCFVNLDMDLSAPTIMALDWFFPRISRNGVILVHDFYDVEVFSNLSNDVAGIFNIEP